MIALALLFIVSGVARCVEPGWEWRHTPTPHFLIEHQDTWLASGLTIGVERVHFRLGMDLGSFSPWMRNERITLYLYRDLDSYVHGQFSPPTWSNGLAIYGKKAIALPGMKDLSHTLRVLAHESTHLLFVSYFRDAHRDPPSWINEGLAMLEEADSPARPETSQWYQSMVSLDPAQWKPLDEFFALSPTKDLHNDETQVDAWYVQAYSVTLFLVRKHSRMQFLSFCAQLKEGKSSADALRSSYQIASVADFEKKWRAWLALPEHKRKVAALSDSSRVTSDGVIEKKASGFTPFQSFSTVR